MEHLQKILKELKRLGHTGDEDICIQAKEGSPTIVTLRDCDDGSTKVYTSHSFDVDQLVLRADF